ncbi:MAG: hypothetical protein RL885_27715 [Planctomycetota bacterium]
MRGLFTTSCLIVASVGVPGCLTPERPLAGHPTFTIASIHDPNDHVPEWAETELRGGLQALCLEELGVESVLFEDEPVPEALQLRIAIVDYIAPIDTSFTIDRGFGRRDGLTAELEVRSDSGDTLFEETATGAGRGAWPDDPPLLEDARLARMIEEILEAWRRTLQRAGAGAD